MDITFLIINETRFSGKERDQPLSCFALAGGTAPARSRRLRRVPGSGRKPHPAKPGPVLSDREAFWDLFNKSVSPLTNYRIESHTLQLQPNPFKA
jgi:hypothetical protein